MATKKKTATTAATATQNNIPEETAKIIMDPNASTAEKLNALQGLADNLPEQEPEPEKEPEPITNDTLCPFEATISVALAVLHKTTGLGTSEMLKPVATLRQGTKVTVTAIRDGRCLLRNGLWIAAEYLTK